MNSNNFLLHLINTLVLSLHAGPFPHILQLHIGLKTGTNPFISRFSSSKQKDLGDASLPA